MKKIAATITREEAVRVGATTFTVGNERFNEADSRLRFSNPGRPRGPLQGLLNRAGY